MGGDGHPDVESTDQQLWNERYRSAARVWSGNPNPQLVAEAADIEPGRALDAGCGEGGDAIWLARRGWQVVAVDISDVALARAAEHAGASDPEAARRIEWRHADLHAAPPEPDAYDLVSAQFLHPPAEARATLFGALAAAVRPGGTLLVVGHHPSDLETGVRRPRAHGVLYAAAEVTALLDPSWTVVVEDARPRPATTPDGVEVTVHDAVLRAVRRPTAR